MATKRATKRSHKPKFTVHVTLADDTESRPFWFKTKAERAAFLDGVDFACGGDDYGVYSYPMRYCAGCGAWVQQQQQVDRCSMCGANETGAYDDDDEA